MCWCCFKVIKTNYNLLIEKQKKKKKMIGLIVKPKKVWILSYFVRSARKRFRISVIKVVDLSIIRTTRWNSSYLIRPIVWIAVKRIPRPCPIEIVLDSQIKTDPCGRIRPSPVVIAVMPVMRILFKNHAVSEVRRFTWRCFFTPNNTSIITLSTIKVEINGSMRVV